MKTPEEFELRIIEKNLERQKMIADLEVEHEIRGETIDEKIIDTKEKIEGITYHG